MLDLGRAKFQNPAGPDWAMVEVCAALVEMNRRCIIHWKKYTLQPIFFHGLPIFTNFVNGTLFVKICKSLRKNVNVNQRWHTPFHVWICCSCMLVMSILVYYHKMIEHLLVTSLILESHWRKRFLLLPSDMPINMFRKYGNLWVCRRREVRTRRWQIRSEQP